MLRRICLVASLSLACGGRTLSLDGASPGFFPTDPVEMGPQVIGERLVVPNGSSRAGDWSCLQDEPFPFTAGEGSSDLLTLSVPIIDFVNPLAPLAAPDGLSISLHSVSSRLEYVCVTCPPASIEAVAGEPGLLAQIQAPRGFDGFVRITAPGYLPVNYWLAASLESDRRLGAISLLPLQSLPEQFERYAGGAAEFDPLLGIVAIRTLDCQREPAAGVRLLQQRAFRDRESLGFTLLNGIPVPALEQAADGRVVRAIELPETDAAGVAGFANTQPGAAEIVGQVRGEVYSTVQLSFERGELGMVDMVPESILFAPP